MTQNGNARVIRYRKDCGLSLSTRSILLGFAALILSLTTRADGVSNTSDPILPNQFAYYNPLKHGASHQSDQTERRLRMDNETLLRSAEQIRSDSMRPEQRVLNHQWLQQAEDEDSQRVGGRAFSSLLRMGFKTYWEGNRASFGHSNRMIPDSQGGGQITRDVDYRIRVSGDDIRLSLEYEF